MTGVWPSCRLGDVLVRSSDTVPITPEKEYKEVTVRAWGKGIILRGVKRGEEIGSSKRTRVTANQFIVSRIGASQGAFGVIPSELNGAVVTSDFPVYVPDQDNLDVHYLNWISKTPWFIDQCKKASEGTTRIRLKEEKFYEIKIPLPDRQQQKTVVDEVNFVLEKISVAQKIIEEIQTEAVAMLHSVFHDLVDGAQSRPMAEIAPIVRRAVKVELDGEYPELGVRSFGKGTFHKPTLTGPEVGEKKLYRIHPDDLVLNSTFAWEGAIAVVSPEDHGRVGSHRFITCLATKGVITPHFLRFYLLSPKGAEKVREVSPGSAGRNRPIGIQKLEKIEIPVPAYAKQLWFDHLQEKVLQIQRIQAENAIGLDALIPSVLDRAFKGKLS